MRFLSTAAKVMLLAVTLASGPAARAEPVPKPSRDGPRGLSSEIARLESELKEQRQIMMQVMQVEQQHYDLLLKLIQSLSPGGGAAVAVAGSVGGPPPAGTSMLLPGPAGVSTEAAPTPVHKVVERMAAVTGTVTAPPGFSDEIYVFAENVHGASARGRTIEIAQRNKQFIPAVAVVQRGTKVVFPNYDAVFHNVFSSTPPHPFDLGTYRAGESPRAIELTSTGVVEVFCNMHAKMRASILVVPSAVWTRVAPNGTFKLDNVPVGTRKLVAWSARARSAPQTIEVGAGGGTATFTLEIEPDRMHPNKYGLPYQPYKD